MADKSNTTNPFIPSVGATELAWLFDPLIPAERRAMAELVETAEVLIVDGEMWLLAPVISQHMLDTLAAFASEGEDSEYDLEDEVEEDLDTSDYEPDAEGEPTEDDLPERGRPIRTRPNTGIIVQEIDPRGR